MSILITIRILDRMVKGDPGPNLFRIPRMLNARLRCILKPATKERFHGEPAIVHGNEILDNQSTLDRLVQAVWSEKNGWRALRRER